MRVLVFVCADEVKHALSRDIRRLEQRWAEETPRGGGGRGGGKDVPKKGAGEEDEDPARWQIQMQVLSNKVDVLTDLILQAQKHALASSPMAMQKNVASERTRSAQTVLPAGPGEHGVQDRRPTRSTDQRKEGKRERSSARGANNLRTSAAGEGAKGTGEGNGALRRAQSSGATLYSSALSTKGLDAAVYPSAQAAQANDIGARAGGGNVPSGSSRMKSSAGHAATASVHLPDPSRRTPPPGGVGATSKFSDSPDDRKNGRCLHGITCVCARPGYMCYLEKGLQTQND